MPRTILFIFGTRPEAIKLAPLLRILASRPDLYSARVLVTAQHRAMLDQVLAAFSITPDFDLDLMTPGQTLAQSSSRILAALDPVLASSKPDLVIVQGDTTTTFCGALAAFYHRVSVAHIEAGLRTHDLAQPFPEEANRVLTSRIAALHFAPTPRAAQNLAAENITSDVFVTGNTGVDAVLHIRDLLDRGALHSNLEIAFDDRPIVLVTAHRRESFGPAFERICRAIRFIADHPLSRVADDAALRVPGATRRETDDSVRGVTGDAGRRVTRSPERHVTAGAERRQIRVIFPVHPNPNVQDPVNRLLHSHPNITLCGPLDYISFVDLMRRASIILTDSGGIQEEGPSLGKPILVLREKTERPEAVEAGTVKLVGSDPDLILREAVNLLENPAEYQRMSRIHNPYGDGHASERIELALRDFLSTLAS